MRLIIGISFFSLSALYEHSDLLARSLDSALDPESIQTINNRKDIWDIAKQLIESGAIPWSGIGMLGTPQLLESRPILGIDDEFFVARHFHNLLLELFLGAGWLGMLIVAFLLYRLAVSFASAATLSGLIYVFFLVVEMSDFSVLELKSALVWGMTFGYAEALVARKRENPQNL